MTESMKKKFEELNMTRDEIERFSEAMKKEEFRKLLIEYAEEISDPKNREIYEREIAQLENERGSDVTFIHPEPGFCMKTTQNGEKKCFINICKNAHIAQPTSTRQAATGGQNGLMWQIPHTCSQPREDVDKSGKKPCVVYDVVFHPDAYRMGETNKRFQKLLIDSAIDTIQKSFNVNLDAVNNTVLKNLNFKGHPTASIIRKPRNDLENKENKPLNGQATNKKENDDDPLTPIIDQIKKEYMDKQLESKSPVTKSNNEQTKKKASENNETETVQNEDAKYTIPKYRILHRGQVDFEDHAVQMDNSQGVRRVNSTRPKELVVTIELPLCKSAANVNLDIFDASLSLESVEPNYKLDLKFPFPVRSKEGKAKFDKSKRALSVTLPVVPYVENVEVIHQISELPSISELASDDANASIVSNDPQNQSSILMSPTSLSSSSSSLSSESIINDDLDSSSIQVEPIVSQPVKVQEVSTIVKHTLPKKILVKETKNHINLKYFVSNYNRDSLKIKIDSESQLSITCDSTSSGGYVQYFATHVHFYFIKSINRNSKKNQLESNDTFSYSFIDTSSLKSYDSSSANELSPDLKVNFVNDELFEIKIRKRIAQEIKAYEDEIEAKKVRVSVHKPTADDLSNENLNNSQTSGLMILDVVQELNVDEDLMDKSQSQKKSEQLNNMSKKDFILNFNKLVKENDQDGDIDEDDDDDAEEEETRPDAMTREDAATQPSKEQTKKMTNAEFVKFKEFKEARKAQQHERVNGCELLSKTEKIDEVPENDESDESDETPDMEKKYLAEMNDDDQKQQNSSSLSSSSTNFTNENQGRLGSSLNGSSSFNRLKGILKKPRSVSESESGALMYCHSMSNASTSSFGSVHNSVSDENGDTLSGSKKCVSFNKQVIRNVFKPGSTIAGMKKPNSNKNNKKKNKRKRTISDPSHDASGSSFRTRSISESSDDSSSAFTNSCESLPEEASKPASELEPLPSNDASIKPTGEPSQKKKKKNKKKGNSGSEQNQTAKSDSKKNKFDMETMLEWKNQGLLPNDEELSNKPNCAIKFKNKIMNDLED